MAYDYFLRLGCLDLAGPQALHYARYGGDCGLTPWRVFPNACACPGLDVATGYPDGWTNPTDDDAPWYDPSEPESGKFAGLIITSVSGLAPGKMSRRVGSGAVDGSVLGRRKQVGPVITVTGVIAGGSCCSVAYGLRWLRQALEGECNQVGCPGEDLTYLECCPTLPTGDQSTFGPPGTGAIGTAAVTVIAPYIGPGLALGTGSNGLQQGGGGTAQPLFDGATYVIPADTGPGPGSANENFRGTGAILKAPRPSCDTGSVDITVSMRFTNTGPDDVNGASGALVLANTVTHTAIATTNLPNDMAAGDQATISVSATVPAADLAAGRVAVLATAETWQLAIGGKGWIFDLFHGSYEYDTTGCVLEPIRDQQAVDAVFGLQWRRLKGVALVSGVEIIDQQGSSCGCGGCPLTTVQFELAGRQPCAYRNPYVAVDFSPLRGGDAVLVQNCFNWVKVADDEDCPDDCAPTVGDCAFNPECPVPPAPPPPPLIADDCSSCTPFELWSRCVDIVPAAMPAWTKGALSYVIRSMDTPLRHLKIRLFQNPIDLPPGDLDPCASCSEIAIGYIPEASILTIDGENRTITLECPGGGVTDASNLVVGKDGGVYDWPTIECGNIRYAACWELDAGFPVSLLSNISISVTAKEC